MNLLYNEVNVNIKLGIPYNNLEVLRWEFGYR